MEQENKPLTRAEMREANRLRKEISEVLTRYGKELVKRFPDHGVGFVYGFAMHSDDSRKPVKTQLMAAGDETILMNIFYSFLDDMPNITEPAFGLFQTMRQKDEAIASFADKTIS